MLNEKQKEDCLKILESYNDVEKRSMRGDMTFDEWYEKRVKVGQEVKEKIHQYLSGELSLSDFRWAIDSINKRNNLWGFNAWKGMFYFNMILIVSDKFETNLDGLIKESIVEPRDDQEANERIRKFYDEVEKVASTYPDKRKGPNPRSTPYFLTYFWEIQNHEKWPIQYPSSESALEMLDVWNRTGDTIKDAQNFLATIRAIHSLYKEKTKGEVPLRIVGHVLYDFFLKEQEAISKGETVGEKEKQSGSTKTTLKPPEKRLPDRYIPPVVSILPQLARVDPEIETICKEEGLDLPTEFEKRVTTAFKILGFEVERRGQGAGREPDLIAKTKQHGYALIIDAKARTDFYRIGTDDRKFIEYIRREIPDLKRDGFKNFYFGVVSSEFSEKLDPAIRDIKAQTEIHGVVMLRAEDLLLALDLRLRNPEEFDLGDRGFKRLLTKDGTITREEMLETLHS